MCSAFGQNSLIPGTVITRGIRELPYVSPNTRYIDVVTGVDHNLALATDGRVIAWGRNDLGQCDVPAQLTGVRKVAAGAYFSVALKADGSVICWGQNTASQTNAPAGFGTFQSVAAGQDFGLGLTTNGAVIFWGHYGPAKLMTNVSGVKAVRAGLKIASALKTDGTVFTWNVDVPDTNLTPWSDIVQLELGADHVIALNAKKEVRDWGNSFGSAAEQTGLTNIIKVFASYQMSMALRGDGMVIAWGYDYYGHPAGIQTYGAHATASNKSLHMLALLDDGAIKAWGWGKWGQTVVPGQFADVISIAASENYMLAARKDGTVVSWGTGALGGSVVPEGLSGVVAVDAGYETSIALKSDGTVTAWGELPSGPSVADVTNAVAVAIGPGYGGIVLSDGRLRILGNNTVPNYVTNIVYLAISDGRSMAVTRDNVAYGWGGTSPIAYGSFFDARTGYVAVACGGNAYEMGLTTNGAIDAIRYYYSLPENPNYAGWARDPVVTPLHDIVAISARGPTRVALRRDGTVACWNERGYGWFAGPGLTELGVTNVMAIDASDNYIAAIVRVPKPLRLRAPVFKAAEGFSMAVEGEAGTKVTIEATTDWTNWTRLSDATLFQTETNLTDQTSTNFSMRFYRVASP